MKRISAVIIAAVFLSLLPSHQTLADVSSCLANVTPNDISSGSATGYDFDVTPNGSSAIEWIKITRPFAAMDIYDSSSDWNVQLTSDTAVLTGSSLDPGNTSYFRLIAQAGSAGFGHWSVEVSSSPSGSSPVSCTGSLRAQIESGGQVNISGINTTVTPSTATITWQTDTPTTSQVDYGLDTDYPLSKQDQTLVTSHSMTLQGLAPSTGYHYHIMSAAGDGSSTTTSDNTFLTAAKPIQPPSIAPIARANQIPIVISKNSEKVPPTISLALNSTTPFKQAPTINGSANDNVALATIEYSVDSGSNWLPVDKAVGLGGRQASFSFTPQNLDDGNYPIVVRATDTSGNSANSRLQTIIIDRLPPTVGGTVVAIGTQIVEPNQQGAITTLAGIDQKMTLSAVGGPTTINLSAGNSHTSHFSMTQSADTGLWSGVISFNTPGSYTLMANAIDGAGNKTSRALNVIRVLPKARTVSQVAGKAVVSRATVYYLEPDSQDWVIWDGASYGQQNPQSSDKKGDLKFLLPAGTYYLRATAKGYHDVTTSIFKFDRPTALDTTLAMKPGLNPHLGGLTIPWPDFSNTKVDLALTAPKNLKSSATPIPIGSILPTFSATNADGSNVSSASWLGKPTVISFLTSWSPSTSTQLATLSKLQHNQDVNIIPIGLQEHSGRLSAYSAIAGYKVNWLADPDGILAKPFNVQSIPTHYFINRQGSVTKIVSGVLTPQMLQDNLAGL